MPTRTPSVHRYPGGAPPHAEHQARPPSGFYYSPAWRQLRKVALRRDGYRCTVCGISISKPGQARVDHIKPVQTHPDLALSLDNLRSLCANHDNQGHREKPRGSGAARDEKFVIGGCDARGLPLDPGHHWRTK
jgi:hypothetical protein